MAGRPGRGPPAPRLGPRPDVGLKAPAHSAMRGDVTLQSTSFVATQRCDVVMSADGALRVSVAGDWLAPDHVELLRRTIRNASGMGVCSFDLTELGRTSTEAARVLRESTARSV